MLIALDPNTPVRYVFKSDRQLDKPQQAALLIRPMTLKDFFEFLARFNLGNDFKTLNINDLNVSQVHDILNQFIIGWENIIHPTTFEPIAFIYNGTGKAAASNWDYLPVRYQFEALDAIISCAKLTELEEKN